MASMSKKREPMQFPSTVKLNIGGKYFTTTLQTLTRDPNSMLAAMFSERFVCEPAEDGAFFIDRDGKHFRFILNYLRTGKLTLPEGATFIKELEEEAAFYQIQGIFDELKFMLNFEKSKILTKDEHKRMLVSWLGPQEGNWRLLFRASRDGWRSMEFHAKCDWKGPTVTIVKNGENIFGGFTKESWTSSNEYKRCTDAFLFSMVNPKGLGPIKLALCGGPGYATYCSSNSGPTFGEKWGRGQHDLSVSHNGDESRKCYSDLGYTYTLPSGQRETFFTGASESFVTDYEVFYLQA